MNRVKAYGGYTLFFLATFGFIATSPKLLHKISRLYQYSYWCWNTGYAGLGEEGVVHCLREKSRILCRKDRFSREFEKILLNLPSYIQEKGGILHSRPGSRTTYLVDIDGELCVVKESCKLPRLFCLLFPSRYSRIAWNNADLARGLGLKVFEPVALVEFGHFLQFSSYLIYPFIGKTLAEEKSFGNWLGHLEEAILKQKELRLIHPDFRPTNVILLQDGTIQYIDIDEMHRYPPFSYTFQGRLEKELFRFTELMQEDMGEKGFSFSFIQKDK